MAATENISFYKGETLILDCRLYNAANTPMDLTSGLVEFRISSDTAPVLTVDSTGVYVQITNAVGGNCTIQIPDLVQSNLVSDTAYKYEIRTTDNGGIIGVQAVGKLVVKKSLFSN